MKKLIFIVLGAMIPFWSNCQATKPKDIISLKILDDSLTVNAHNWKKSIAFKVYNDSQRDLFVYGLNTGSFRGIPFEASQLCDVEDVGLGLGLIIYDNAGVQLSLTVGIVDRFDDPPMTKSRLDSIMTSYRNSTASDFLIFKHTDEKVFVKSVDITPYELEKGTYFLQIVMYCGKRITFSVNKETIAADRKRSGANLFQGCSFSNRIRLIVE
jgi:hypothetical protein